MKLSKKNRFFVALGFIFLVIVVFLNITGSAVKAASLGEADVKDKYFGAFYLESFVLKGTSRIGKEFLINELNLRPNTHLTSGFVEKIRNSLLGLGIFRSVILYMRKGSQPGKIKLIIEVWDDESVLTDWALGGEVAMTYGEPKVVDASSDSAALGYRFGLIGRNIFKSLHRSSVMIDIDSMGHFCEGQFAYGLPKFTEEDINFNTSVKITNTLRRYINAMGFGKKGEAFWTKDLGDFTSIKYGIAMYLNSGEDYSIPYFPKTIAGPKISYGKETRFFSFFPTTGYQYRVALMPVPYKTENSAFETSLAGTYDLNNIIWGTLEGKLLTVGTSGISTRLTAQLDLPIVQSRGRFREFSEIYLRLQAGKDRFEETNYSGSSAVFGLRYHSYGFIAELAFKIVKTPKDIKSLDPKGLHND